MAEPTPLDFEVTLQTLNYAARLVASELDTTRLVDRALDTLCDFGQSSRVALLTVDEDLDSVEVAGELSRGGLIDPDRRIPLADSPLGDVIETKQPQTYPAAPNEPLPLPSREATDIPFECLCLPLIGGQNQVIGVATLERPSDRPLADHEMQVLNVVTTLIAVAMENARLFRLATVDGLTGLYVRRYFEIRLQEEMARLRRHGGVMAVMMTDIDHFKQFNDTYGHQQGDIVLRELAGLVRTTIRTGLDIPCRYGGEEFVVIMPETDLEGAQEVAERVRRVCEEHEFPGQTEPLRVTVSGGVAVVDREQLVTESELVRRADAMLYEAKEGGRNQIRVWRDA